VVGSEGHGLSPTILAACDGAFAIPAPPPDEDGEARSLNVGVAAGIALYELAR
jgi:23S rRNA (guanosine2251-2'-O)-methyltransferase